MSLIARNAAMGMAPIGPPFNIGKMQIRNGFAIITLHAGDRISGTFAEQCGELSPPVITASGCEVAEEIGSPLRAVILETIMKPRARFFAMIIRKPFFTPSKK